MPVITLEAGKLNKEQKSQLVKDLTSKAAEIMNVPEQAIIVFINENNMDNIGFGGKLLSEREA
ncbi:tautomerase family protein [Clostridium estertheticum]|uniref:Tautomerase family protein n=1 Tax=Clostridium estertheticum TaxID=238834 RepID=A0AA47EFT1_9CLOT|nr:4-oxalocrotonate tautomerase DmpI [Clostridium estertheticum]MBU3156597.1 tautomerase family protein [Clostridium estertheticum]MBU3178377.1 tautomerase family protein [Clostridium estertheticum]MBU3201126.1 tautomerase family protein [Clostridium estertheticum]WAG59357.1 tautomerase family protein [Clostridium estertheticum]WAG66568.1 tautomerase family protein [Clostridium estertheticum]